MGAPAEGQVSRSDLIARLMAPSTPPAPSQLEKELVGTPAEGQVSRSDLIALAGAAAVAVCGGPRIAVPIGRPDATGPDPGGPVLMTTACRGGKVGQRGPSLCARLPAGCLHKIAALTFLLFTPPLLV